MRVPGDAFPRSAPWGGPLAGRTPTLRSGLPAGQRLFAPPHSQAVDTRDGNLPVDESPSSSGSPDDVIAQALQFLGGGTSEAPHPSSVHAYSGTPTTPKDAPGSITGAHTGGIGATPSKRERWAPLAGPRLLRHANKSAVALARTEQGNVSVTPDLLTWDAYEALPASPHPGVLM